MTTLCPIRQSSPMSTPPWSWNVQLALMNNRRPIRVFLAKPEEDGGKRVTIASMGPGQFGQQLTDPVRFVVAAIQR